MAMLTLNPYVIVTKNKDTCQFIGKDPQDTVSFPLSSHQQETLLWLSQGNFQERERLWETLGARNVQKLEARGFLTEKSPDTHSIYSRSRAFLDRYLEDGALTVLQEKSVLILGCGGIGTHMAWHLAALGVSLTLLDFDTVEESNLNRQLLFDQKDIGRLKTQVLKEKLMAINPGARIQTIQQKIVSEKQLQKLCSEQHWDLIVKALDSPAQFPLWLDHVCKSLQIPYVAGITMQNKALIGPTFLPGSSEIGWSDLVDLSGGEQKLCGTAPSLGAVLYHISGELALEAIKVLTGKGALQYQGRISVEDPVTGEKAQLPANAPAPSRSAPPEPKQPVPNAPFLNCLLILALSLWGMENSLLIPISLLCSLFLPFFLYQSGDMTVKAVFLNSVIFSGVTLLRTLVKSGVFFLASSPVEMISLLALSFGAFSGVILINSFLGRWLCHLLKRI